MSHHASEGRDPATPGGLGSVRAGELAYYDAIGDAGRTHSLNKPLSSPDRTDLLAQTSALLSLLPQPPADVLDCACGTGWLTRFLARSGYAATGVDIAETAIRLARDHEPATEGQMPSPQFVVANIENAPFESEFDAVVFFDSLHHSVDERAALASALRALRPGGVCITSEPGKGHAVRSAKIVADYDVTERDMPARHIREVGLDVGFASARIYPRLDTVRAHLFGPTDDPRRPSGWRARPSVGAALTLRSLLSRRFDNGLVVLEAPAR